MFQLFFRSTELGLAKLNVSSYMNELAKSAERNHALSWGGGGGGGGGEGPDIDLGGVLNCVL